MLNRDCLMNYSNELFDVLSFKLTVPEIVLNNGRCPVHLLRSYADYLKKSQERSSDVRDCIEVTLNETIPNPTSAINSNVPKETYKKLSRVM